MKNVLAVVGGVLVVLLLVVGGTYGYLHLYKDVAPQFQAARREVFENTPSYIQGKAQTLSKLKLDYERAESEAQRATLKELISTEAVTVDREKLPQNVQSFLRDLGV
jgi:hypothetical protein